MPRRVPVWAFDRLMVKKKYNLLIPVCLIIALTACQETALVPVEKYFHNSPVTEGTYHSLDGIYAFLNGLNSRYPDRIHLLQTRVQSVRQRPIPVVRIETAPGKPAKKYLLVSGTHGDEAIAVEAMIYAIAYFTSDSVYPDLDKNITIDFIPVHNPDGYAENQRENATGKDLNRDFPFAVGTEQIQPETRALIDLVNEQNYNASFFFHSANEIKYENLIRCPVEYRGSGPEILAEPLRSDLLRLGEKIIDSMNVIPGNTKWQMSTGSVNAGGIASDWCVSGQILTEYQQLVKQPCKNSHPSFTIELCYPKQPLDQKKIMQEKHEMVRIIKTLM